jgi:hypothetical protein
MASSFPLLPGFAPTQDLNVSFLILAHELQTLERTKAGIQPRPCNFLIKASRDDRLSASARKIRISPRSIKSKTP